jgi:hypothetical protein
VFEPIFRYDADGELRSGCGDRSADAAQRRHQRRREDDRRCTSGPGMHWSDGAPYDARDLVFTWHAVMNPRNNTRLQTGWDDDRVDARCATTIPRSRFGSKRISVVDSRLVCGRRFRLSAAPRRTCSRRLPDINTSTVQQPRRSRAGRSC